MISWSTIYSNFNCMIAKFVICEVMNFHIDLPVGACNNYNI